MEGLEGVFVHHYRLVQADVSTLDLGVFLERSKAERVAKVCSSQEVREDLLDRGITVRYSYVDQDHRPIGSIDVTPSDCSQ